MSQHSSLKSASVTAKHRNVLKRYERIRALQEAEKWGERKSIYKLPKHRMIKLKIRKEKSAQQEETQAVPGTASAAQKAGGAEKAQAKPKA